MAIPDFKFSTFEWQGKQTKGVVYGIRIEDLERNQLENLLVHALMSISRQEKDDVLREQGKKPSEDV